VAEGDGPRQGLFPPPPIYVYGIVTTTPGPPAQLLVNTNSGSIYAIADIGNAFAWYSEDPFIRLDNSGLIVAQATVGTGDLADQTGFATTIQFSNGGQLYNSATGSILAEGTQARAFWSYRGGYSGLPGGIIDNAGLIEASSLPGGYPSVGLFLGHLAVETMVVTNSGTIGADHAIYAPSNRIELFSSIDHNGIEQITNTSSGLIDGDILLFNGNDILVNRGRIEGLIDAGKGNDSIDSAGGQIDGIVRLDDGDDSFIGSTLSDRVAGGNHADVIEGREGADLLLGGFGDDTLTGGVGSDGLYGEFGNDVIVTLARDHADGGEGKDRIETGDLAFAFITGGAGVDTWQLAARDRLYDLSLILTSGRVADFEAIRLGADNCPSSGHLAQIAT
jgi:Ca2+-binding RTX toxin-like protein